MLIHPEINPVALQLGPLAIHWYGLTYLAAFALFFFLATRRLRHEPFASITGPGAWARRDITGCFWAWPARQRRGATREPGATERFS